MSNQEGARMNKGKMTPGPWAQHEPERGLCVFAGNQLVAEAALSQLQRVGMGTDNLPEAQANAHAIACLPELVEAAQAALDELDTYNMSAPAEDTTHAVADTLRRILARIKGEDA